MRGLVIEVLLYYVMTNALNGMSYITLQKSDFGRKIYKKYFFKKMILKLYQIVVDQVEWVRFSIFYKEFVACDVKTDVVTSKFETVKKLRTSPFCN